MQHRACLLADGRVYGEHPEARCNTQQSKDLGGCALSNHATAPFNIAI